MFNRIFIFIIQLYRRLLSPLFPPVCRFTPTCSEYSLEAFRKHSFFKAFFLSVARILRCNPLFRGGYDPLK